MVKITGIMACDPQGVIAKNGQLPWNYPEEKRFFLETTTGHINIMGEVTFKDTLIVYPGFINTGFNIVFSYSSKNYEEVPNTIFVSSIDEFLNLINSDQMPIDKNIS